MKALLNILLLQTTVAYHDVGYAMSPASWTLATLFVLWLVSPFIIIIFNKVWSKKSYLLIFFICFVIIYCGYWMMPLDNPISEYLHRGRTPFRRIFEYMLGMFGFVLTPMVTKYDRVFSYLELPCIILLPSAIAVIFRFDLANSYLFNFLIFVCISLILVVFYQQNGIVSAFFRLRLFQFLGNISLGFYLLHYVIIKYFAIFCSSRDFPEIIQIGFIIGTLLFSIFAAWLTQNICEKLTQKIFK